jgi:CheY-like chemotaxis protein
MNILVVDDREDSRSLIAFLLQELITGAEVKTMDEDEALAKAHKIKGYDVVIIDLDLKSYSGRDFIKDHSLEELNDLVLLVSAFSADYDDVIDKSDIFDAILER